ncbi:MAG: TIGR03617 family F420-dependent LLM class oxidoreductase [Proteobacteria bacterium]|nr:TIGR03617 family F420-dependent LLM class oxidoreductase [Pseudomonadota bacterium]
MKIDASLITRDHLDAGKLATRFENEGYDGVYTFEGPHDPFLPLSISCGTTSTIDLMTSVAIGFARNPMILANLGYDLQLMSKGRFTLGLGSQIKPHIEKRFSMPWSSPAKRMGEMVAAIKAIWNAWQFQEPLNFRGEFYSHTLMTPFFNPGENPFGIPKILMAAVGPLMLKAAAENADGIIVHPFHSAKSFHELTLPALGNRFQDNNFDIVIGLIVGLGTTQDEIDQAKLSCASQISFYGSTPAYKGMLEVHGFEDLHLELNRLSKQGEWIKMREIIPDEVLQKFAIIGTPAEVGKELLSRYDAKIARVQPTIYTSQPELQSEFFNFIKG